MPTDCHRSTSGGKGNFGKFIEKDSRICAAGIPSAQPDNTVKGALQCYLLKDEVDALVSDTLVPPPEPRPLPPLRHPIPLDTRHSTYTKVAQIVNPPPKTKFQTLVNDFKDTVYASYWKKPLGRLPDSVHMMPEGFDILGTTYGKKTPYHGRLYDIVMPRKPFPDKTPRSQQAGVQEDRKYCSPPFTDELTYGYKSGVDTRGRYAKCCLTDDRIVTGNANQTVVNSVQVNFQQVNQPRTGTVLAPNDNKSCVPEGFTFGKLKPPGNLPECLTSCELNPGRDEFKMCLKALNTLRKALRTKFLPSFFEQLYLNLKYFDKDNKGWLPKDVVYKYCASKLIRFDQAMIEPLLSMWKAFDGSNIEFKIFTRVLNYREPSPEMPRVPDIPDDCISFETTYTEMVNPNQKIDVSRRAGLPSGRYLDLDHPITPDLYCRADRTCLPQESDMKSCINPSIMTLLHVNHRDMYEKREPNVVRRVFEAAHGKFTDEQFNTYWEAAKQHHSEGCVSYQTLKRAFENITNPTSSASKKKKGHH